MDDDSNFREAFARVARWIEDYYTDGSRFPVLSRNKPGDLSRALPSAAPGEPESWSRILDDFERLIVPGVTHWNHPRFFGYFAISATPITVLAEALTAALDVNAMLWRTSPAATELESVTVEWLRKMLGISDAFHGLVYDSASIAGFTALAAAREAIGLAIGDRGMIGRPDLAALRVYVTEHTHSHIEKAAIALGIGRDNVVKVDCDAAFGMRPDALEAGIAADLLRNHRPFCVVATVGTMSSAARDPITRIAEICERHNLWLHVDAAYAGPAAMLPELRWIFDGVERADSLVIDPHKWLFVPIDLSVLYVRRPEAIREAFKVSADYPVVFGEEDVHNSVDYGLQTSRRFRALKLWFALRALGTGRVQQILRSHVALAGEFASWVDAEPDWQTVAPHPLSVVCYRYRPSYLTEGEVDILNEMILEMVNASGEAFISATRLHGQTVLRLAIGNERTTREDVQAVWNLLKEAAHAAIGD